MTRAILVVVLLIPTITPAQTKSRPATNGFYVQSERGWLRLTAYAEYWSAGEALRMVSGSLDDAPEVSSPGRFAVQMPNWRASQVVLLPGDSLSTKYPEHRTLTFGVRRTGIHGHEINVANTSRERLNPLLEQVGVASGGTGYIFLVVATEGFPDRYYPVTVRRTN